MKFLHISDLHFGLKLCDRDLSEDQRCVLDQVVKYAADRKPQAIVIAGDVYNVSEPSLDAIHEYGRFISALRKAVRDVPIMVVSGNHDSAERLDLYRKELKEIGLYVIGLPPQKKDEKIAKVVLKDEFGPVNFYLLPFVKPTSIKEIIGQKEDGKNYSYSDAVRKLIELENIDATQRNVLVSHQYYVPVGVDASKVERANSERTTIGNVDAVCADVLDQFDYAALGHIHKPWALDEFHRYCGTPAQYSVNEEGQKKGVVLVELGAKGTRTAEVLPLTPLHEIRKVRGTLEEVCKEAFENEKSRKDYVVAVLTDKIELDVNEMKAKLNAAYPNLLRYERENNADFEFTLESEEIVDKPFDMCMEFLGEDLNEDQEIISILREIVDEVVDGQNN